MTTSDNHPPAGGSVLDKYRRSGRAESPSQAAADPPIEHRCFSEMPIQVVMVDLHLASGDCLALPYHYLEEARFDRSGVITLTFHEQEVKIHGRHLHPLYSGLTRHRVGRIEPVARSDFEDGDQTVVTEIAIQQRQ